MGRLEVGFSAFHLLGTETEVGGGGFVLLEEGGARVPETHKGLIQPLMSF